MTISSYPQRSRRRSMEVLDGMSRKRLWLYILVAPLLCFSLLYFNLKSVPEAENAELLAVSEKTDIVMPATEPKDEVPEEIPFMKALRSRENHKDPCGGRYIYIHTLPRRFNDDILKNCKGLDTWFDICKFALNNGLGPALKNRDGIFSRKGWYDTDQFALDLIFSNRMKHYECLTRDPSMAAAFFVPFYAGLDVARYLWGTHSISERDANSLELTKWLVRRPEWKIMGGRDHFLVAGRITWDFRREKDSDSEWGNKLLLLPELRNMSMLVIEASPWHANDFAVPYPTYFHPSKDKELSEWLRKVRRLKRSWLFSFVGAPRPQLDSIRGQIIGQCTRSTKCKLMQCGKGRSSCYTASNIIKILQNSVFCLQPSGDSFTRRSTFDAILSGCIPVFFHPGSAYTQYIWHLPRNYSKYSVLIPEDEIREGTTNIEKRLLSFSQNQIKRMREEVINLIPKIVYADPRSKLARTKDAFDISVQAVIDRVTKMRMDMVNHNHDKHLDGRYSWNSPILEPSKEKIIQDNDWSHLFNRQRKG